MPETIDWPTPGKSRRPRLLVYLVLAVVLVIFIGGRTAISYWVDLLWFGSLGYASVFWKTFEPRVGNLRGLCGAHLPYPARRVPRCCATATRPICLKRTPSSSAAGPSSCPWPSSCASSPSSPRSSSRSPPASPWSRSGPRWRFIGTRPHAASVTDPIFGRPLGFYLFTLPAWQLIAGWLLTLAVIVCVLAVLFLIAAGGGRALGGRFGVASLPWRGVSIAAGFLLFALAIREYVGRFELLFEQHTIFAGVTYTDAHVTLIGMLFISAALAIGAVIAIAGGILQPARALAARGRSFPRRSASSWPASPDGT